MGGTLTLGRWISDRARNTPNRVAIDFLGAQVTYAELDARSERLAASLFARGLGRGDRLATLTGNSPEHVALFFACAKTGIALQPLSWRLSPAELLYQLDDAAPTLLLVSAEHEALARATGTPVPIEPLGEAALAGEGAAPCARGDVADDDPLLLVYTSGTTGKPKGAVLTNANCFWTNLSFDRTSGIADDDIVLQVLPQYHVGGWNVQPLLAWWKGATVVLEPSFEAGRALALIEERCVTTLMGVPATYLTGDIAERDEEGYYRIVGRLKDMVISGGENVYPAEIEAVLHAHTAVAEAAVIGVPDERWGEVCLAFVALKPGREAGEVELIEHCRALLARFKVPSGVRFVGALPRSGMNKVQKDELRASIDRERVR